MTNYPFEAGVGKMRIRIVLTGFRVVECWMGSVIFTDSDSWISLCYNIVISRVRLILIDCV